MGQAWLPSWVWAAQGHAWQVLQRQQQAIALVLDAGAGAIALLAPCQGQGCCKSCSQNNRFGAGPQPPLLPAALAQAMAGCGAVPP